jgi:hypothetical protein
MRYIIITFFLLTGCGSPCNEPLFIYEPTEFNGDCFVRVQDLVIKEHFDKVEKVLGFYNVAYERTGVTSIQFKKGILPELVYNYGSKAESNAWLQQRDLQ